MQHWIKRSPVGLNDETAAYQDCQIMLDYNDVLVRLSQASKNEKQKIQECVSKLWDGACGTVAKAAISKTKTLLNQSLINFITKTKYEEEANRKAKFIAV